MSKNSSNVSAISCKINCANIDKVKEALLIAASESKNVFFNIYVDDKLKEFDYSHRQVLKLLHCGEYTDFRPERGRKNSCGFTVAFKFGGDVAACHIRGWFDMSTSEILISDVFLSEMLSV